MVGIISGGQNELEKKTKERLRKQSPKGKQSIQSRSKSVEVTYTHISKETNIYES